MTTLEKIKAVMNRSYWQNRVLDPNRDWSKDYYPTGLWIDDNFSSFDYDSFDAKSTIDEIATILRSSEQKEAEDE